MAGGMYGGGVEGVHGGGVGGVHGGGGVWQGGMRDGGACVAGGHAWQGGHAWREGVCMPLWHVVNERVVCILLECILVSNMCVYTTATPAATKIKEEIAFAFALI